MFSGNIKVVLFAGWILLVSFPLFSQNETVATDQKAKDRYVIWLIPSAASNIYGIAIGPVGSEAICNRPYTKYSHGLNLQIPGQGIFQTFYIHKGMKNLLIDSKDSTSFFAHDTLPKRAQHNGILISPLGTFTPQVNGISLSCWMSLGNCINGLSINLLWNLYNRINGVSIGFVNHSVGVRGLQIGLFNKTRELKGFQLGLWNMNKKRSLPILNWNFKRDG
jgi:hypothetical protein